MAKKIVNKKNSVGGAVLVPKPAPAPVPVQVPAPAPMYPSIYDAIKFCQFGPLSPSSPPTAISNFQTQLDKLFSTIIGNGANDALDFYYGSCNPIPQYNLFPRYVSSGNYYSTTIFPGYKYIYIYSNSTGHLQYKKLISLPDGVTVSGNVPTAAPSINSPNISKFFVFRTRNDIRDTGYLPDEVIPVGGSKIKKKK